MTNNDNTITYKRSGEQHTLSEALANAYDALKIKGYDPINQIVGYLISGDPTYITNYRDARYIITGIQRDELVEEIVRSYFANISANADKGNDE